MDWPIHVGYSRDIRTARGGPTHHANASVPHRAGRVVFSAIRAATGAGRSSFNHLVIGRRELGGTAQHKLSSPFMYPSQAKRRSTRNIVNKLCRREARRQRYPPKKQSDGPKQTIHAGRSEATATSSCNRSSRWARMRCFLDQWSPPR